MEINTASAVIAFSRKLEEDSAKFYEELVMRFCKNADIFQSFTKENRKYTTQVERTYYEVITDALEGCFAYGINPDEYSFPGKLPEAASYQDALKTAIQMENNIVSFYQNAAEQSKSLMADVPRAFALIAKKRTGRLQKLNFLYLGVAKQ